MFCEKCGSILVTIRKKNSVYLFCRSCMKKYPAKGKMKISEKITEKKPEVIFVGKIEGEELPRTKVICPNCENVEAFWWMQQTRSGDEPPTIFYKCTKCKYSWRVYG